MNRADAIALDELAKKNECKACTGVDIEELKRKSHMCDKAMTAVEMQNFLITSGEFLMKVIESNPDTEIYKAANKKLMGVVDRL